MGSANSWLKEGGSIFLEFWFQSEEALVRAECVFAIMISGSVENLMYCVFILAEYFWKDHPELANKTIECNCIDWLGY